MDYRVNDQAELALLQARQNYDLKPGEICYVVAEEQYYKLAQDMRSWVRVNEIPAMHTPTGSDDWATRIPAVTAYAGRLNMARGTHLCSTGACRLPSRTRISGDSAATIINNQATTGASTINSDGSQQDFATPFNVEPTKPTPANDGVFMSSTRWSKTCTVAVSVAAPVAGQYVLCSGSVKGFISQIVTATHTTGFSYNLTLRDAILFDMSAFAETGNARILTARSVGQTIEGIRFTGVNAAQEVYGGRYYTLRDCSYDGMTSAGTSQTAAFQFDCWTQDSLFDNCFADLHNSDDGSRNEVAYGFYFEGGSQNYCRRFSVTGAHIGIAHHAGFENAVENSWATDCAIGVDVDLFNSVANTGNSCCAVRGGGAVACTTGLHVANSDNTTVTDWGAYGCTTGVKIETSATLVRLNSLRVLDATDALTVAADCSAIVSGMTATGITGRALVSTGTLTVSDATLTATSEVCAITGGTFNGTRLTVSAPKAGAYAFVLYGTSHSLADVAITMAATGEGVAVLCSAGTTTLRKVTRAAGGDAAYGLYVQNGATAKLLEGCNFDGFLSPITVDAGGAVTIQQTGGVAVKAVTTADVTLSVVDSYCTRISLSGTLTGNRSVILPAPFLGAQYTVSNGTSGAYSVTIKASAGDTGVAVAQGKTAILQVNSAGAITRVTADV